MSGVGDEMSDVSRALERAQERTDDMEARAAAMDELQESGTFEDALSDEDEIDRQLDAGRTESEVDAELETLKTEVGSGEQGQGASSGGTDADVEAELDQLREDEDEESA
jgi:phage shock protein A